LNACIVAMNKRIFSHKHLLYAVLTFNLGRKIQTH
jgi:hypothetical protein